MNNEPINIDFKYGFVGSPDSPAHQLKLKLLYQILDKYLPASSEYIDTHLKPNEYDGIIDPNTKISYDVTVKQPYLLVEEAGHYYYAVKSRKREPGANIGVEGAYGKFMRIYAFLFVDKIQKTLIYIPNTHNTRNLGVKVNCLKMDGSGEPFKEIRNEAANNSLIYKNSTVKNPIFVRGSRSFEIGGKLLKLAVIKVYQIIQILSGEESLSSILDGWKWQSHTTKRLHAFLAAIQALRQLHKRKMIHRDYKPDNVIYSGNNAYSIDHALSVHINGEESDLENLCGTPTHTDPLILLSSYNESKDPINYSATYATDIWSLGVTLVEILSQDPREVTKDFSNTWLKGKNIGFFARLAEEYISQGEEYLKQKYPKINLDQIDLLKEIKDEDRNALKKLIQSALVFTPKDRPSIDKIYSDACEITRKYSVEPAKENEETPQRWTNPKPETISIRKFVSGIAFFTLIGLVGGGLLYTGIFSWVGLALLGVSAIGLLSLGIGTCYQAKNIAKPTADSLQYIMQQLKTPVENNDYYRPILSNGEEFLSEYSRLDKMLGWPEAEKAYPKFKKQYQLAIESKTIPSKNTNDTTPAYVN